MSYNYTSRLMSAFVTATTVALTSLLGACGGGQSNNTAASATPSTPEVPVTPPVTPPASAPLPPPAPAPVSTLQTAVPAPTYVAGSPELEAFQTFNKERENCGFGLLRQNALIDIAARGQADYIARHMNDAGFSVSHYQDPKLSGFTGVTPSDRAKAAGYAASVGEVMTPGWYGMSSEAEAQTPAPVRSGEFVTRSLINTVYHMAAMMNGTKDVGIAITTMPGQITSTIGTGPDAKTYVSPAKLQVTVMNQGSLGAWQKPQPDTVQTYPCEGSKGLMGEFGTNGISTGETPDPFQGLRDNVLKAPSWGHPLYFVNPSGGTLTISSAQLSDAQGNAIPLFTFTHEVDPHNYLNTSQVFLIPLRKLEKNASYLLQVQGLQSGKPFAKAFTFSTGSLTPLD